MLNEVLIFGHGWNDFVSGKKKKLIYTTGMAMEMGMKMLGAISHLIKLFLECKHGANKSPAPKDQKVRTAKHGL